MVADDRGATFVSHLIATGATATGAYLRWMKFRMHKSKGPLKLVTAVPRWLLPIACGQRMSPLPPRELFSLAQVARNSQAQEIGEHVSPRIGIAYTSEESERSQGNNQDICVCSSRRYERLSLERI